jgi:hypothetical protein
MAQMLSQFISATKQMLGLPIPQKLILTDKLPLSLSNQVFDLTQLEILLKIQQKAVIFKIMDSFLCISEKTENFIICSSALPQLKNVMPLVPCLQPG